MKNVVGYIRVSTQKQADSGLSVSSQQTKLEAYAHLYDLNIVSIEIDAGESAKSLDRPALQKSLGMLKSGEAEGLLVYKLDRLTRSMRDFSCLMDDYFIREKYALISVCEQIDTKSPTGRLLLNFWTSISQWERETIGERTSLAMQELKRQGRYTGGSTRYGYEKTTNGFLQENELEQLVINKAKSMKNLGFNLSEIARELTQAGHKSRTGRPFQAIQVKKMLAA